MVEYGRSYTLKGCFARASSVDVIEGRNSLFGGPPDSLEAKLHTRREEKSTEAEWV